MGGVNVKPNQKNKNTPLYKQQTIRFFTAHKTKMRYVKTNSKLLLRAASKFN